MTYEPAADRMDIARLANEALALAARLPGQPSRVKMRSGTCEIEIEWPSSHDQAAEPDHADTAHAGVAHGEIDPQHVEQAQVFPAEESGRHRRPGDDEGRPPSFSLVTG